MTSIPIISDVNHGNNKFVSGTGFLYVIDYVFYLITAYHVIFNTKNDSYKRFQIGFQSLEPGEVFFVESHQINSELWLKDKENDVAILPLLLKREFQKKIMHTYLDQTYYLNNQKYDIKGQHGIYYGFGHGFMADSSNFNLDLARTNQTDRKLIEKFNKPDLILWLPIASMLYIEGEKDNKIQIIAAIMQGFSGCPVFVKLFNNRYYLVGILVTGHIEDDEYKDKGSVTKFNNILSLINDCLRKNFQLQLISLDSIYKKRITKDTSKINEFFYEELN